MENWGLRQELTLATSKAYRVTFSAKQLTGVGEMYSGLWHTASPFFSQVITSEFVEYSFVQTPTDSDAPYDTVHFGGKLATGVDVTNTFEVKDVTVKEAGEDWNLGTGWSIGDGEAIFDYNTSIGKIFTSNVSLNSSSSYKLSFEIKNVLSGTPNIFIANSGGSVGYNGDYTNYTEGVHTLIFSPASSQTSLSFFARYSDFSITDISVKEIASTYLTQDVSLSAKTWKIIYSVSDYIAGSVSATDYGAVTTADAVGITEYVQIGVASDFRMVNIDGYFEGAVTGISAQLVDPNGYWTLGAGWSFGDDKAVNDGSVAGNDYLISTENDLTIGKTYKVIYTVLDYIQGNVRVRAGQASSNFVTADGTYTEYMVATSTENVRVQAQSNFIGSITNISVEEVDPNDYWTLGTGWVFGTDKAISDGTNSAISQLVTTAESSIKIQVTVAESPSLLEFSSSLFYGTLAERTLANGANTYYLTTKSTDFSITNAGGDTGTITGISVIRLDPNNDWSLSSNWRLTDIGAESDGTSNNDINQSKWFPELGDTYKIEYTIFSISEGAYKIKLGGETTPARDTAGTYIEYVTTTDLSDGGGRLRIQIDNEAIGVISSISVFNANGLIDIEFENQLTSKKFDFPNISVLSTNGRYSSMSITPPAETSPPSNAIMVEGMYLVTFKLDQINTILATRLAFVGSLPAFKEATFDSYKVGDGTAYNVYVNG